MQSLGRIRAIAPGIIMTIALQIAAAAEPGTKPGFTYPESPKSEQVDLYHGVKIADPYRWLEDANSEQTRRWIEAQNKLTFGFLESVSERGVIRERLSRLWNFEKFGVPVVRGNRYFFAKNDGLQNQAVVYVQDGRESAPRVLIDPNTMSADGTVALSSWKPNDAGTLIAYGVSASGSDWNEWKVRDVQSGRDLPDLIRWVKFSEAEWSPDGGGFYYGGYDEPNEETKYQDVNYFQKLYFHKVGTDQAQDQLVYERPDKKEWGFAASVTEDGRFLVITVWQGTDPKTCVFYRELSKPEAPVVELLPNFEAQYQFLGNEGPLFWFQTDHQAARGRVIAIDTRNPATERRELIAQSNDTIESVSAVGGRFVVTYLHDAHSIARVFELDGRLVRDVMLPGIGSVGGFDGRSDSKETFFSFSGFTTPATIYRYEIGSGESSVFRAPRLSFDPSQFETKQVFVASKDGVRVPMFITHKKGLRLDGTNPTYLYGYGGFSISLTPTFNTPAIVWMEMGGVYAVANLRGGGEYGEDWHLAGTKSRKQNVFDDFIAAGEWLIANKYTSRERLAIGGGSNGGLLVGACITQRPDLFGAAAASVGVLDMLRYDKFTIGWAWASDYGTADNPDEFKTLLAYSPLHNARPGVPYPATLLTTADHDDRVVPAHSFKFAAALQAAQAGPAPVLIRVDTKAGHGAGKPMTKLIDEATDRWSFFVKVMGIEVPKSIRAEAAQP